MQAKLRAKINKNAIACTIPSTFDNSKKKMFREMGIIKKEILYNIMIRRW
jgi:hypothetical protein